MKVPLKSPGGYGEAGESAKLVQAQTEKFSESEHRNRVQLERDRLHFLWESTKKSLADETVELRNKDLKIETMEKHHRSEVRTYKQKFKHVLYEQQSTLTALKQEAALALRRQRADLLCQVEKLHEETRFLRLEVKDVQSSSQELVWQLKLVHSKEITKIRQEQEMRLTEARQNYEKKVEIMRGDFELKLNHDLHEIEERKNAHISSLISNHDSAFTEMKNYYNAVTHNNLDVIKSLKEDIEELKTKESTNDQLIVQITQENERLLEPLSKALQEVSELRKALVSCSSKKQTELRLQARLSNAEKILKKIGFDRDVLTHRFESLKKDRDNLHKTFDLAVYDVQEKGSLKSLMLERKLEMVGTRLESHEAKIGEILAAAGVDPAKLSEVTSKLDAVLSSKNQIIRILQCDLHHFSKAHNNLIQICKTKLFDYGISVDDFCFGALVTASDGVPTDSIADSRVEALI